ncbi:hypothetical protein [Novosphingobium sp. Gsoil 351]|uniref:hypothetical protein n=1 Tax=Novosphingobium sp. Gsoil 351 TaxID=2675225 RepID=UPI0012B4D2C2|nr:hypothetical protein [Novosphingobium sp. Gsoil 351]QGN54132.1 hypothetical protein GKE62_05820 [Novosphingobium sp. Gsoil 351]
MSAIMIIGATRRADVPTNSFLFFRLLAIAFLVLDLLKGVATGEWAGIEFLLFVLTAEYAAIIRTIPPREAGKSARKIVTAK